MKADEKKLTKRSVETFALPPGKTEAFLFDPDLPGFGVRQRGESKVWVFQYRLGGQQRRMTLGAVSAVTLTDARKTAEKLYAQVKLGQDPAGHKAESRSRAAETFAAALKPFMARQKQRLRPRSYYEAERYLLVQSKPLHPLALAKIERRSVAALLASLADKHGPVAANRCRANLSTFFSWAVREGLIDVNPAIGTNRAVEAGARDRVLTVDELRDIWSALGDGDYAHIVRLLLLTGARRDEIGSLSWSEVDLERRLISLPPDRTKNKRPFDIPLSVPAMEILRSRLRSEEREFVFGEGRGGFSGWSKCKERLDQRIAKAREEEGRPAIPKWQLHDARRLMSTLMHERLSIAPHIVEACINHVSGHQRGVAGVYNRSLYNDEKRRALNIWANHVIAIVEGRDSNAVQFRV